MWVAGVDLDEVTAAYVVRRLTETYAMRRATLRMTRRDLARARELLAEEGADTERDPATIRERNRRYHFLCYERCGMPALTERIAGMWRAFPWDLVLHSSARSAASHREHLEIMDALEAGDPDRVAEATERHLRNGFAAILSRLVGRDGPDPFGIDVD